MLPTKWIEAKALADLLTALQVAVDPWVPSDPVNRLRGIVAQRLAIVAEAAVAEAGSRADTRPAATPLPWPAATSNPRGGLRA
jgi:hypothetical protein